MLPRGGLFISNAVSLVRSGRFLSCLLYTSPWSSASCNPSSKEADRKITMVAPCSAKEEMCIRDSACTLRRKPSSDSPEPRPASWPGSFPSKTLATAQEVVVFPIPISPVRRLSLIHI